MDRKQDVAFKVKYSLEQRKKMFQEQMSKTPQMIPIILERDHKSKIEPLDKKKYLSGPKYTFFQFMETTKKLFANKIKKSEALCFYIAGKVIENGEKQICDIYKVHRDEDGFLYIYYGTLQSF